MAINHRAFVEPPAYEIRGDKHFIILHTLNWNAHDKYGSTIDEIPFKDERSALKYMEEVTGYVIQR